MVLNHFPIIGTIFGLGILISGLVLKNNTAINIAYILFVVSALFGFASMYTGDGAEEMVEDFPSIGKQIIHEHEEMAEKFAILLYALGAISIGGLVMNIKNHAKAKLVSYVVLIVAVVGVVLAKEVGTTGGEIRHTEIRVDGTAAGAAQKAAGSEQGEKDEDE
jgi:uncharacterized membrane protein